MIVASGWMTSNWLSEIACERWRKRNRSDCIIGRLLILISIIITAMYMKVIWIGSCLGRYLQWVVRLVTILMAPWNRTNISNSSGSTTWLPSSDSTRECISIKSSKSMVSPSMIWSTLTGPTRKISRSWNSYNSVNSRLQMEKRWPCIAGPASEGRARSLAFTWCISTKPLM